MRCSVFSHLVATLALFQGLLAAPFVATPDELLSMTAGALENDAAGGQQLEARQAPAVTASLLQNFVYIVQFAAAVYCNNDKSQVGQKVTCSNNACPTVQANNVVNYAHLDTDINADMDGAVYVDHTGRNIVVAWMGSKSVQSYLIDLDFTTAPIDLCSGCKVSYGYVKVWTDARNAVLSAVNSARAAFPGYKVVATGHSAGGAMATISAAYLRRSGIPVDIYTFGCPRLGNGDFANFVTNQAPSLGANYRVTHYDDPVPSLPASIFGMAHYSPEYWLQRKDASSSDYPLDQIKVCTGINPSGCRASTGVSLDTKAHSYYFQRVSACYRG